MCNNKNRVLHSYVLSVTLTHFWPHHAAPSSCYSEHALFLLAPRSACDAHACYCVHVVSRVL